jgi:hypothetical protein
MRSMRSVALFLTLEMVTHAGPVRAEPAPAKAAAGSNAPAASSERASTAPGSSPSTATAAPEAPVAPLPAPDASASPTSPVVEPLPVPAPPAAAPEDQPPRPLPPDHSFVHLGSSYAGAQLELQNSIDQGGWRAACLAPCDVALPVAGALARVTAPGMTSSNTFRIEPGPGTALVRVDGGSAQARSLGITGLFVGIPTAVAGMALLGYGKLEDRDGIRIAGTVVLATGAVILAASLPLLVMGSTKVRDAHGRVIAETLRTGQARF